MAGEIYNQTENTLWIGSVQITFRSDQAALTIDAPVEVAMLPPQRKIAFFANAGPMIYDSYAIDLLYVTLPSEGPGANLGIEGHLEQVGGAYRVRGRVENLGAKLDDYAVVVATLFDSKGRAAGVSSLEIASADLLPGAIQAFEITIEQAAPDVSSCEVQVFGF